MILKARAEKGSVSELFLVIASSSFWYLIPLIEGTSKGDGKKSTTASNIGWTPLFLNALPQSTGTNVPPIVPFLINDLICSSVGEVPSRYFSIISSSNSTTVSTNFSLYLLASSIISSGISSSANLAPSVSSCQITAFILTRSIKPLKFDSEPKGSWITRGLAPSLATIISTHL